MPIQRTRAPVPERFFAKVEFTDTCWLWIAGTNGKGYGLFRVAVGHQSLAHRWAYEFCVCPIPEGLHLDHVKERGCTSRLCVNPDHLEPVTCRVNLLRGDTMTAKRAKRTHCPAGHPYDEANTYITARNERKCRACGRRRANERRAQTKHCATPRHVSATR